MLSSVHPPVLEEDNSSVPSKKPTRQWDAWTRQEEENFFNALRQVGKNFEKITNRVQSKNKDQVRHYYYRVIKRMNRMLGPGLVLDAKNTKDANAAMLQWWSLLEKHSCSASKLHLKPRRFKTFVTKLEHQLLKDRKKTKRKKVPAVESSSTTLRSASMQVNPPPSGISSRGDAQIARKSGVQESPGKRKSTSRKPVNNAEATRPPRQRRKVSDGSLSIAAIKRWERAASAGVALMAEAAEHLERAAAAECLERLGTSEKHTSLHGSEIPISGLAVSTNQHVSDIKVFERGGSSVAVQKVLPMNTEDNSPTLVDSRMFGRVVSVPGMGSNMCGSLPVSLPTTALALEPSLLPSSYCGSTFSSGGVMFVPLQTCKASGEMPSNTTMHKELACTVGGGKCSENVTSKLKLQLFPIDDFTRKALEQDGLNPHLELTLKGRKPIASVLQHLNTKWGKSAVATGELRLFPFNATWNHLADSQSWNLNDIAVTAADVHEILGSPLTFRLRYGWLSSRVLEKSTAELQEQLTPSVVDNNLCCTPGSASEDHTGPSLDVNTAKAHFSETCPKSSFSKQDSRILLHKGKVQIEPSFSEKTSRTVPEACLADTNSTHNIANGITGSKECHRPPSLKEGLTGKVIDTPVSMPDSGHEEILGPSFITQGLAEDQSEKGMALIDSQVANCNWFYEGSNDSFVQHLWTNEETPRSSSDVVLPSELDWVDNFTNISIGELLCDVPHAVSTSKDEPAYPSGKIENSSPSLDCFKALQTQHCSTKPMLLSTESHQPSSIWGADDTCDAFSFQRHRSVANAGTLDGNIGYNKASSNATFGSQCEPIMPVASMQMETKFLLANAILEGQIRGTSASVSQDVEGLGSSPMLPLELYLADSLGASSMGINHQSGLQEQDFFLNGDSSLGFSGLIGILGQGSLDCLLGQANQGGNNFFSQQEKHSSVIQLEIPSKGELFGGEFTNMSTRKTSCEQHTFEPDGKNLKDSKGFNHKCTDATGDDSPTKGISGQGQSS